MIKLPTGLAAAAALALFASAGQACEFHQQHVMASAAPTTEQPAAASQQLTPLPVVIEQAKADTTKQDCPVDATDCAPVSQ